ncbi:MAG TPA: SiaB family protein kinase [Bacteroidia bacterium]|nr:SiaB family protein kinase [Bacteroidia bacterium]
MISEIEVKSLLLDPKTDWFYLGDVDEDLISSFVTLVESKPHFLRLPRPLRRRLVSAVVECLQNIHHYAPAITTPSASSVVFMQRYSGKEYYLRCGNMMLSAGVDRLRERLDIINASTQEVLRTMYMEQMERSLLEGSRTNAGLGLLEIARAITGPIRYKFVEMGNGYTFFSIELYLSLN